MSSRFSAYRVDGATVLNAVLWNRIFRDIDTRIVDIEQKKAAFEEAEKLLIELGLARINEALLPAFQTIEGLANLGALLTGHSDTTLSLASGEKQLTIVEADRDRFAPAAYLGLQKQGDPGVAMTGALVDYHRETGTLTVDIDQVSGEGEHAPWVISATVAPEFGAVMEAQMNAALDDLAADIATALEGKAAVDHHHDDVYAALAHGHAIEDVTGLGTALDARGHLNAAQQWLKGQSGIVVPVTHASSVALDLDDGNFFAWTLTGNATLANPSKANVGQAGSIWLTQDGTGGRTLAFGSDWKFAGGEAPDLSEDAGAVDRLDYAVKAAGFIDAQLAQDIS